MNERRFRASICVDVWVKETDDLEDDRQQAWAEVSQFQQKIPNSYVGGVAYLPLGRDLLKPLDREI